MTTLTMFSVYDQKAGAYLPPFFLPNRAMAKRVFGDCCNSDDHQFGAHPADYTLTELGEFNTDDGTLSPEPVPNSLGTGVEYITKE